MDNPGIGLEWIKTLDERNFLLVYALVQDVASAANLSVVYDPDGAKIADVLLLPENIRFPELLPVDSLDARRRLCNLRADAAELLTVNKALKYVHDSRDSKQSWMNGWNQTLRVWLPDDGFDTVLAEMKAEFEWRAKQQRGDDAVSDDPIDSTSRVFIGHGGSLLWLALRRFLSETLHLECDEFNEQSPAGIATSVRLESMLATASFAFLLMTSEDVHTDGTAHARENVIHEAGLFQGRLGFKKAIILLEEGCEEFSNIRGLGQIRFPKGKIDASFEQIRQVLRREQIIAG